MGGFLKFLNFVCFTIAAYTTYGAKFSWRVRKQIYFGWKQRLGTYWVHTPFNIQNISLRLGSLFLGKQLD
jgi:hypothetical protein